MEIAYFLTGAWVLWLTAQSTRSAAHKGGVNASFFYFAALVLLPSLSGAVAQFTGGRAVKTGPGDSSEVVMSGIATFIAQITPMLIAATAGIYFLHILRARVRINTPSIFLAAVLIAGGFGALNATQEFPGGQTLITYMAFAPVMLAARTQSSLTGAAHALAVLTGLSGVAAVISPATVMMECSERKCGVLGHLFAGISPNFNSFGMLMALAVPVLFLGLKRHNMQITAIAAIYGILSESRTSQVAIILSVALIIVHQYKVRHLLRSTSVITLLGVGIPAILAAILPFISLPSQTFTGRAGLWELARAHIQGSAIVGLGPDSWSALQKTGEIRRAAAYSAHNQVIDVLFISGIAGLVFFAIFIANVTWSNRVHLMSFLLLMAPVAVLSITERPWSVGRFDWLSWSLFLTASIWFGHRNASPANRTPESIRAQSSPDTALSYQSTSRSSKP